MAEPAPGETMTAVPRTLLIVDDHDGFRHGARALLETDGFEVVGEAADGQSAIEVAERLADGADPPAILLTSSRGADAFRRRLANSPARGFITKAEMSG